ncbi:unnamed protein product [Arctogadus glacialis]
MGRFNFTDFRSGVLSFCRPAREDLKSGGHIRSIKRLHPNGLKLELNSKQAKEDPLFDFRFSPREMSQPTEWCPSAEAES